MRRLVVSLGFIACVAGCASETTQPAVPPQPMGRQQFEQVSLRMARSDVEAILGRASGQSAWTFPSDSTKAYPLNCPLYTQAYYGTPPSPRPNSAVGIPGKIVILFDDKDHVIQKTLMEEDADGIFTGSQTDSVLGADVSVFHKLDWSVSSFKKE